MRACIFLISVAGLFFSIYLLSFSIFAVSEFNDYILIALQLILLAISITGIIMHHNCMDAFLYALRIKKRGRI